MSVADVVGEAYPSALPTLLVSAVGGLLGYASPTTSATDMVVLAPADA